MRWLLAFVMMVLAAAPAFAEQRSALLIGNSSYRGGAFGPLKNPVNDARLMETTLRGLGFDVVTLTDASQKQMEDAIGDLGARLGAAGKDAVGLFYYSGHGVQSQGMNYLVPSDAVVFNEPDLWRRAPNLGLVEKYLGFAGNRVNFVILDACRSNTLPRGTRDSGAGLVARSDADGMLIAYATKPGAVASDGEGDNSPYTAALANVLASGAGLSAEFLFKRTGERVRLATNGVQQPWFESGLYGGDFCFGRCDPKAGGALEASETALHRARAEEAEQRAKQTARQLAELQKQQAFVRRPAENAPPDPAKDRAFFEAAHVSLANLVLIGAVTADIAAPSAEVSRFVDSTTKFLDEFAVTWDAWAANYGLTYRGTVPGAEPSKRRDWKDVIEKVGHARVARSVMENERNSLENLQARNSQGSCHASLEMFLQIGWKRFTEAQQNALEAGVPFKPIDTPKLTCTPDLKAPATYADQYLDQLCAVFQSEQTKGECARLRETALGRSPPFSYPPAHINASPKLDIRPLATPPDGSSRRQSQIRWFEDAGLGWTDQFDVWLGPISKGKRDGCGIQLENTGELIRACFVADALDGVVTVAVAGKGYFRGEWNKGAFSRKLAVDLPPR